MKKTVKRLLAMMLVVVMTIGAAPLSGFVGLELPEFGGIKKLTDSVSEFFDGFATKAEAATSGTCGENLIWTFVKSTGTLSISGTGQMYDWNSESEVPWSSVRYSIKSLEIDDGVTSIGDYAFARCRSITNVSLPNTITSIGDLAFFLSDLDCFIIPNGVKEIGKWAILLSDSESPVLLPESVISLGEGAFCYVDDNGNIFGVPIYYTGTSEQFDSIKITGKYNFISKSKIHYLKENEALYCAEYYRLNDAGNYVLSKKIFNVYTVGAELTYEPQTSDGFNLNLELSELRKNINSNHSTVFKVYYHLSVTSVRLTQDSANIGIGNSVQLTTNVYPYGALNQDVVWFSSDENIAKVNNSGEVFGISEGTATITVKTVDGGYTDTCEIKVRKEYKYSGLIYLIENGEAIIIGCERPISGSVFIPLVLSGCPVVKIENYAFYNCPQITDIIISDSVKNIGDAAFSKCSSLESVTIGKSVEIIGDHAFSECTGISNVNYTGDVDGWCSIEFGIESNPLSMEADLYVDGELITELTIPENVKIVEDWFGGCSSLLSLTIPDGVTSIGDQAFYKCSALTSVTIPNSVTSIGADSFCDCINLNSIIIPDSITSIGSTAFYNSGIYNNSSNWKNEGLYIGSYLIEVNYLISGSYIITEGTKVIADSAFGFGGDLTSVTIPNSVISIGDYAFFYCDSLTSITIPDGVTTIGDCAFLDCNSLTSITIPDSITSIGYYAFSGCSSLTDVYYTGTEAQWNEMTIENFNECLTNATIHYNYDAGESDELKLNQELITISNNVSPIICVDKYPKGVTADDLIWSSSNDGVAYVNEDNVVTPLHYGKTDITVSTVDGKYSATCEVTVEASFVITSESSNVKSVRCGDTAKYRIYFLNYLAEELPVDDVTATITENGVLEVLNCNKYDKYIELEVKAVSEGAEVIEVESDEPLAYNKFKISVYPENIDFRADKVPNYGKTDKENFRRSTFIVENYNYVYNENNRTYTVTMDVYNMAGDYPVLAAYNSFGELVDFDAADRFVAMPGDWIEFFGTLGFGAVQMITGDLFTYKSVTSSKKSTISVVVPADGYITISNDIQVSPAAAIFNLSSLLFEMVGVICDFSDSEADENKDITKEFIKSLKKKIPSFEEHLQDLFDALANKISSKATPNYLTSILLFSKDEIYEMCEDAGSTFEEMAGEVILSVLDKDIQSFISKTAMETLIVKRITDAATLSQLKAADKYFKAGKLLGVMDFILHAAVFNPGSGRTTIQFNPGGENGFVCKDTIKITSTIIDDETLLHHYVIKDTNKKNLAKEELKFDFNDIVEIHEIALMKNGQKVEGVAFNATVEMEIPSNMFLPSVKVYRVEKDGTYTELKTNIVNGKIVFTTDHFSEYILIGRSIDDVVTGVSLNTDMPKVINKRTYQLEATVLPNTASNKNVVWSSDNEEVATVDENGLVTANSPGTAIITATTVDGGYSASCKVTVLPREFTVTWNIDGVETSTTVSEGSAIIKPENPTKDGYKFMDWTPAVPEIMPSYDLTFNATWTANNYDVVFDANGGKWSDGAEEKIIPTAFDSQIVTPENPAKQGYVFSLWSPEIGIMDDINGKKFFAEWIPATDTRYTVETYTMNTTGEYEKSSKVFSGVTGESAIAEYNVTTGFTLNTEKSIINGTISADSSLVLKVYIDRNVYTFTTVVDGVSSSTTYLYGSMVSEPITPSKSGYKFINWNGIIPQTMPAKNVTVTAVFEKSYICLDCGKEILGEDAINKHIADEMKVNITNGAIVSGVVAPGAIITVKAEQIDGKVFNHWEATGAMVTDDDSAETTIVLGSGKISITAVYDDCECKCHKGGITAFFFKIVVFFQKLFGKNVECICGAKH